MSAVAHRRHSGANPRPRLPAPVRSGDEALTEPERRVLEVLRRVQRQHAAGHRPHPTPLVSREELATHLGAGDRVVRQTVESLRRAGHPVLSSQSAKGYWLSDDPEEIGEFLTEMFYSRITSLSETARALERPHLAAARQAPRQAGAPVQTSLWSHPRPNDRSQNPMDAAELHHRMRHHRPLG